MMKDVAGMKGEKEEIQEFINFLRNPERYRRIGAKMPKGVLLSVRYFNPWRYTCGKSGTRDFDVIVTILN